MPFSAVLGGVAEVRQIVEHARERRSYHGKRTILFVDEIRSFNKSQQDAFFPHHVRTARSVDRRDHRKPCVCGQRGAARAAKSFGSTRSSRPRSSACSRTRAIGDWWRRWSRRLEADPQALAAMAHAARGDARKGAEPARGLRALSPEEHRLTADLVERAGEAHTLYDKAGEEHYNVVSALIKSMREAIPTPRSTG